MLICFRLRNVAQELSLAQDADLERNLEREEAENEDASTTTPSAPGNNQK